MSLAGAEVSLIDDEIHAGRGKRNGDTLLIVRLTASARSCAYPYIRKFLVELAKIVHVVSTSPKSFDDAVQQGVANAVKTLRGVSGVKITDWTAKVENDKITTYKVTMDIAFGVEESR